LITNLITEAVRNLTTPGAQYAIVRPDQVHTGCAGHYTYGEGSPPVTDQTLFDIASLTKVLAGSSAAMLLWQEGRLDLEQPLVEWLPKFASPDDPRRRAITIRMLLAHSSGLPAHRRLWEVVSTRDALIAEVCRTPLETEPGTSSNVSRASDSISSPHGAFFLRWACEAHAIAPLTVRAALPPIVETTSGKGCCRARCMMKTAR
jgi:CubicO group peptidase (beta-lactamase class C family)